MDLQRIKLLLEKYYRGETSLEEEKILKEHFRQENSSGSDDVDKQIINFLDSGKTQLPTDFYQEFVSTIENEWKKDTKYRFIKILKWTSGIAAIFILAIGIMIFNKKDNTPTLADTYKNKKEAYAETKQVLLFISYKMNRKANGLKYLSNIDNSLKQVTALSKINETLNSIKNENN
jgi:hypothetical protein